MARLEFFPNSADIFDKVGIADGLSIVFKDMEKKTNGFQYVYSKNSVSYEIKANNPGEELMPLNPYDISIVDNINDFVFGKYAFLHDSVLSQKLFSIESDFAERNPDLVRPYSEGDFFDKETEIKLFTNDKAGKAGRATWFIANKNVITTGNQYLNKWKVIVSSANAGGQKRSNQIAIVDNYSAFGRSRVALKTFDTEKEAINFYKYANSELIRFAFLLTEESLSSLAKQVPDILNYKDDNGLIDFDSDINAQLYKLFNIDEPNQKHIREVLASKSE